MKKNILIIGFYLSFISVIFAQEAIQIPQFQTKPELDGKLESVWTAGVKLELKALKANKPITNKTNVYLGYFDGKMYIAVECFEDKMKFLKTAYANPEEHDNQLWQDDCIEFFIHPYSLGGDYYHIIINSAGISYDAHGNDKSWESGINVVSRKYQDRWTFEMELPFTSMGYNIKGGEFCYMNIGRDEKPSGELSAIIEDSENFRALEAFTGVRFVPKYKETDKEVFEQCWWREEKGQDVLRLSMRDRTRTLRKFKAEILVEVDGEKYFNSESLFDVKPGKWINRYGMKYSRPETECIVKIKIFDVQNNREVYNAEFVLPSRKKTAVKNVYSISKPLFKELVGDSPVGLAKNGFLWWFSTSDKRKMRTFAHQYGVEYVYENEFRDMAKRKEIIILNNTALKNYAPLLRKYGAKSCIRQDVEMFFFDDDYDKKSAYQIDQIEEYRDIIVAIMLGDEVIDRAQRDGILLLQKEDERLRKIDLEVKMKYGGGKYGIPEDINDSSPLKWIAYNAWLNDRLLAISRAVKKHLQKKHPEILLVNGDPRAYSSILDYADFENIYDIFTGQLYPAFSAEISPFGFYTKLFVDLTGSKEVWPCPHVEEYAMSYTPEETLAQLSDIVRNGATGLHYYLSDTAGRRKGKKCLHTEKYGAPQRFAVEMQIAKELEKMNRLDFPIPDAAVLYSIDTIRSAAPGNVSKKNLNAYMQIGPHTGIWFKFISDATIKDTTKSLDRYKVIFLADAQYLRSSVIEKLEEYVKNGGILVALSPSVFNFDNYGKNISDIREKLFGVKSYKDVSEKNISWGSPAVNCQTKVHKMELSSGTKPLLTFKDGTPAIAKKKHGKGKCLFFSFESYNLNLQKNANWRKDFIQFCSSLGLKTQQNIWRFEFPLSIIPKLPAREGNCLTGNFIQWRQFNPITNCNLKTGGTYTYSIPPDLIVDSGGIKDIPFTEGDLTDRLQAPSAGNVELVADKSINDWIVGWKKIDPFYISFDFKKAFSIDRLQICYSGWLPHVEIETSLDGVAWKTCEFECAKDNNVFKDDVRIKLIVLKEKNNARYIRVNFGKRPDNEKLILAEIDIWQ